jgi:hypothetical protein
MAALPRPTSVAAAVDIAAMWFKFIMGFSSHVWNKVDDPQPS